MTVRLASLKSTGQVDSLETLAGLLSLSFLLKVFT